MGDPEDPYWYFKFGLLSFHRPIMVMFSELEKFPRALEDSFFCILSLKKARSIVSVSVSAS